ncbi:MAG: hypothetical protein QM589_08365 [Thermomicrobiales bacterium]
MPDPAAKPDPLSASDSPVFVLRGDALAIVRLYGAICLRMLAVAVPIGWVISMATTMSFLRANTIEAMVTGLTTAIVIALVALVLVVPVALVHWLTGVPSPADDGDRRRTFIATAANVLLLVMWAIIMILQHRFGTNLFFWHLTDIDEPYALFNPDIDPSWRQAFFLLIGITVATIVARYLRPAYATAWFVLTTVTAVAWLVWTVLFTRSNDVINPQVSIASLEGTATWWEPGGAGGAILIVLTALVGYLRIRAAWTMVRERSQVS